MRLRVNHDRGRSAARSSTAAAGTPAPSAIEPCDAADFSALGLGDPPGWIVYTPPPPLFLLAIAGLCLVARP